MKTGLLLRAIMATGLTLPAWIAQAQSDMKSKEGTTTGTQGATAPTVVEEATGTVRYDIYEVIEKNSETLTFAEGKTDLTDTEKQKLRQFVTKMQAQAPVEKFIVAAWADADYPASGEELPKEARKLAEERAKKVEAALKEGGAGEVETFEMTKRPNWFQKAFSTEAAEVKGAARQDMWTDDVMVKVGEKLRSKGGPNKVAVVARFEGAVAAH